LGIWAGPSGAGEGAKYWMNVLTEIKNRGVQDVLITVCDGLRELPEAINAAWAEAMAQTCGKRPEKRTPPFWASDAGAPQNQPRGPALVMTLLDLDPLVQAQVLVMSCQGSATPLRSYVNNHNLPRCCTSV
jgi:hypothetical protein